MIDGVRVREIAVDFRKRRSCAADHVVIEMLRELDSDIWETIAELFSIQADESLDRGHGECLDYTAGHHGQEKEWQAHDAWFPSDCDAADYFPALLKDVATTGGRVLCNHDVVRNTDMSRVGRPMKWCGCSDDLWNRPRNGKIRCS